MIYFGQYWMFQPAADVPPVYTPPPSSNSASNWLLQLRRKVRIN